MSQAAQNDFTIEASTGNVYADLALLGAENMLLKAKLASKISDILKQKQLTQHMAAELLDMTQPKISLMLRGQFRGISEAKMLSCLAKLGRDVDIVVRPAPRRKKSPAIAVPMLGRMRVVFA